MHRKLYGRDSAQRTYEHGHLQLNTHTHTHIRNMWATTTGTSGWLNYTTHFADRLYSVGDPALQNQCTSKHIQAQHKLTQSFTCERTIAYRNFQLRCKSMFIVWLTRLLFRSTDRRYPLVQSSNYINFPLENLRIVADIQHEREPGEIIYPKRHTKAPGGIIQFP